jgi:uncharacterized protein YebE (UPF0316 family)
LEDIVLVTGPDCLALPILPMVIFVAETCVVTISTVRIIAVARGLKALAAGLSFFEITMWLFAIGQVMTNLTNPACFIAFAGGFVLGNYLGITLEEKMALGSLVVRVITRRDASVLIDALRQAEYGVTSIDAQGATGPVQIVFTVVKRRELDKVVALIKRFDAKAFYSVDDLHSCAAGVFPLARGRHRQAPAEVLDLRQAA